MSTTFQTKVLDDENMTREVLVDALDNAFSAANSLITAYAVLTDKLFDVLGDDETEEFLAANVDPVLNGPALKLLVTRAAHDLGL